MQNKSFPSSFARNANPRIQTKIEATGFVEVSRPLDTVFSVMMRDGDGTVCSFSLNGAAENSLLTRLR